MCLSLSLCWKPRYCGISIWPEQKPPAATENPRRVEGHPGTRRSACRSSSTARQLWTTEYGKHEMNKLIKKGSSEEQPLCLRQKYSSSSKTHIMFVESKNKTAIHCETSCMQNFHWVNILSVPVLWMTNRTWRLSVQMNPLVFSQRTFCKHKQTLYIQEQLGKTFSERWTEVLGVWL